MLGAQGEQVGVVIARANQGMALGQGHLARRGGVQQNQGLLHELLGQRLDMAVAVHALLHGTRAGGVYQPAWVSPHQANNAPKLALAHTPFALKQDLTQPVRSYTDRFGLAQNALRFARGIEDPLLDGQHHRAGSLSPVMAAQQGLRLEIADFQATRKQAHQNPTANGRWTGSVAAMGDAHARVVVDGVLALGKVLHAQYGQGQEMGFLFLEHGLHLAAFVAMDTLRGPLGFPVFEVLVLLLNRLESTPLQGGGLCVADGMFNDPFRISSQLQTISSIRIRFFESRTPFIRSMDESLL